jgi:short-subunit dehydrogenase
MEKYILVTASTKGLGFEIARTLSYSGYNIILTSRSKKNLKYAKTFLNPKLKHKIVKIDFTKDDLSKKLVKKIKHLALHSIVHNFGLKLDNDTHPVDVNIFNQSVYNNFTVSIELNNLLNKYLIANPSKIIYIGSTASLHAKASPSYTLSKSLINTYVKNISAEYLKKGIMICAVLPGALGHLGSDIDKKKLTDVKRYNEMKDKQPLGRFGLPKDISPVVVDLIQQKTFIQTGSVIKLDANEY